MFSDLNGDFSEGEVENDTETIPKRYRFLGFIEDFRFFNRGLLKYVTCGLVKSYGIITTKSAKVAKKN